MAKDNRNEIRPDLEKESSNKKQELPGIVSLKSVKGKLDGQGYQLAGERKPLSRGFFGAIYLLETEQGKKVVEKTFTDGNRRFQIVEAQKHGSPQEIRSRLGIVGGEGKKDQAVIDWVYNEEMALKDLKDIPGIPKSFGAVYEGAKGSILEEHIEGYDLTFVLKNTKDRKKINELFDKVIETYTKAAEQGYVYNQPWGSTIMVSEKDSQPYLMDWYNYSMGDVRSDGPVKNKFEQGLSEIGAWRKSVLEQLDEEELARVKERIG